MVRQDEKFGAMNLFFGIGILLFAWAIVVPARAGPLVGVATVVDGDTLDIHGQRIRLHGIDAAESGQSCRSADGTPWRCGQRAALALSDRLGRSPVTCTARDTDRYGRLVAVCHQGDGTDINRWMVAAGHALAYRRYSMDYVASEDAARAAGSGLWQGAFVPPRDWRRGTRLPAADRSVSSRPDCRIKGNINSRGKHIFHVPGGAFYARTRIDEAAGERWFCTEDAARAAGWRASRR